MAENKTIRESGVTNNHRHTYNDARSGTTSETNGHTHPYVVNDDGSVVIGAGGSDDHIHSPASENMSMKPKKKVKKNMDNVERKDYRFELKQFDEDPEFFYFKAYGSTFGNVDSVGDIVVPGSFKKSLEEMTPKLLYQHDMRQPVGVITEAREDDIGLWIEGKLPKSVTLSRDVGNMLKTGVIDSMSIGFLTDDYEMTEEGMRLLKGIKLFEVSFVTLPANPRARVTDIKAVVPYQDLPLSERSRPWDAAAAESRVREWAGAEDGPNAKYREAFIWYDREDENEFGGYKLQIADIIDGELTAVWRGVTAAAAATQGARGGVDIPEADMARARTHLSRYYNKAREEYDDDTIQAPWDRETSSKKFLKEDVLDFDKRSLERALRETGCFSNEACKFIASKFVEPQRDVEVKVDEHCEMLKDILGILSDINIKMKGKKDV